jgi:hypothetical protein
MLFSYINNRHLFIIGLWHIVNLLMDMIYDYINLLNYAHFCKNFGIRFYNNLIVLKNYFIRNAQCLCAITFHTTSSIIISTFLYKFYNLLYFFIKLKSIVYFVFKFFFFFIYNNLINQLIIKFKLIREHLNHQKSQLFKLNFIKLNKTLNSRKRFIKRN